MIFGRERPPRCSVEPEAAVAELAELVHQAGAPDNAAFVVADVLVA
jgi:hypothetical protein